MTGKLDTDQENIASSDLAVRGLPPEIKVTLLTGGGDKPYAFGLATALLAKGIAMDLIGSDELDCPEFHGKLGMTFLNLRGDQRPNASFARKVYRVAVYYARLIQYASRAKPGIFHILWNNKFESFDRTLLMLYYKWLGKSIVLTAHNVNSGRRDSNDTRFNRFTLQVQYRLADHIFVHTEKMRDELREDFGIRDRRITAIPFGINNAVPDTQLTPGDARRRLGIRDGEKAILFFGTITPYKGLEYLVTAFQQFLAGGANYRLIIAGRPNKCEKYWRGIRDATREEVQSGRIVLKAYFIPDEETEVYFKAADVLVLPYRAIYQSGVLFLAHSFGLPVLAAAVGSLKENVVEGKTGFVFRPEDPDNLAKVVERYFASDLYANLATRRQEIQDYTRERHSWDVVAKMTRDLYTILLSRRQL